MPSLLSSRGTLEMLKILSNQSCTRQLKISTFSMLRSSSSAKDKLAYNSPSSHHSHNQTLNLGVEIQATPLPVSEQYNQTTQYEPTLIVNPSTPTTAKPSITQSSLESQSPHASVDTVITETSVKNPEFQFSKRALSNVLLNQVDPRSLSKVYYFDSLAFTKRLEAKGFTRDQAEACVECLLEIIGNTLEHQAKHMITKSEQRIAEQQLQTEIMSVKKDMVLLQKSEFSSLRTETEKISLDIARIEGHFQDEIVKLKGQFTLDVNLERGRAVEAHAVSEKNLQMLNNKIETEIAHLKTTYEVYRNDIFKYAAGTVLTCTTLIIGFIRLWK